MDRLGQLPGARELGLVPGLTAAELRRVYRQLARRYHPDSGADGSNEIMRHINALHDTLKRRIDEAPKPAPPSPSSGSEAAPEPPPVRKHKRTAPTATAGAPKKMRRQPRADAAAPPLDMPDETASLGELSLTAAAREMMSEALITAVDSWLVSNRGVPRNMLRRRMLVRFGRIGPVDCPGLHMPGRVSMTRLALRFHFLSRPIDGLNLIALPALVNEGIGLAPTGAVSVVEECLTDGQERYELPPDEASELGFELRYRGRRLSMELLFDAGETDYSSALYHMRGNRFRGLFRPPQ